MKKSIFFAFALLLSTNIIMAMSRPRRTSNIVKQIDPDGTITYKDLTTNFWVKYYPSENRYEGKTSLFHGTFQEPMGGGEMERFEPTQEELKGYYDSLNSQTKRKLD